MSNTLTDLNNALFDQLRRLGDRKLTPDDLEAEIRRTDAIVSVSHQIAGNADLQLKAARLFADHGAQVLPMLPQIGEAKE